MFNHPSNQRNLHLKQATVTFSICKSIKNCKIYNMLCYPGSRVTFPHSAAGGENWHTFLENNLAISNESPETLPTL